MEQDNSSISSDQLDPKYLSDRSRNLYREENILLLDEDHFSVSSELELLDELEINPNLSREEQVELAIKRLTNQLTLLPSLNPNEDAQEQHNRKKKLVKRICDLKVKLVKLKEEEDDDEFEPSSCSSGTSTISHQDGSSDTMPDLFMARRQYSFRKTVAGHKLVLSADIFENENRLRTVWKRASQVKPSGGRSSPNSGNINQVITQSLVHQTTKILQLINHTSNQLFILANNLTTVYSQTATNPFSPLVCDHCCKKSTKSINEIFAETLKFMKPPCNSTKLLSQQVKDNVFRNNPYLVCVYCFFTVHVNCLNSRTVRKCPKIYFDEATDSSTSSDHDNSLKFYSVLSEQKQPPTNSHSFDDTASTAVDSHRSVSKRTRRVILQLRPEIGLAKQEFRCAECRVLIGPVDYKPKPTSKQNIGRAQFCDYTGAYFCENCHFGDTSIVPARVIHNWDFTPQPVSRVALQIISYLKNTAFHYDRPVLFNLVDLNSMLYGLVEDLVVVKRIRSELCQIYKYISICKQPSRPKNWILTQLGEHFLDDKQVALHSFIDLCDLKNLAVNLAEVEQMFINHINSCVGCQGKGFFCELCSNRDDVLFPFSPNTTICMKCSAIYHKNCFYRRNRLCPRCTRIKDKLINKEEVVNSGGIASHEIVDNSQSSH